MKQERFLFHNKRGNNLSFSNKEARDGFAFGNVQLNGADSLILSEW
jgi:hypothetical protein